jgi:hypothetical protein
MKNNVIVSVLVECGVAVGRPVIVHGINWDLNAFFIWIVWYYQFQKGCMVFY